MLAMIIERLWVMSLQACVLIMIVLIAGAFLKKYPKGYAYCLWALVGLRLLCPVFIETSFSLQPDMQGLVESTVGSVQMTDVKQGANIKVSNPARHEGNQELIGQSGAYEGILDRIQSDLESNAGSIVQENTSQLGELDVEKQPATGENVPSETTATVLDKEQIFEIFSVIYIIGVSVAALFYVAQHIIIRRRIATAVKGKGNVWFSENISSPFVIGIIRPRIILPYDLTDEEMVYILKHERTHIRHHDPLIRLLGILCIILHWWNPFVWVAVHKMNQDMEMFCDEAALSGATPADKKAYAGTLLSFSVKRSGFSVGLAFGESNTERRVRNIMKKNKKSFIIVGIIALLAVFCVVAFMTIPKSDKDGNGKEQETTTPEVVTTEQPTTENKVTIEINTSTMDGESQKPTEDATDSTTGTADVETGSMNPFYEAFLRNEISVQSPYDPNDRLSVMDDKKYETEFVNAKKSYALVDVNGDERPELIFKMVGDYPSVLMYIFGSTHNELVCYDVFETHTNKMAFGVYDYGLVWWHQNYDGDVWEYYSYTAEGKKELVNRFT
ncbi:MAG: M56 family metallopeptidase, partial [Lachnospiraceae bacterium]|nr:M56 family metallopeptidase [Lachnospiraceae bacterium]